MVIPRALGEEKTAGFSAITSWRTHLNQSLLWPKCPGSLAKPVLMLTVWAVAAGGVLAGPRVSKSGRPQTRANQPTVAGNSAPQQLADSADLLRGKWTEDTLRHSVIRYDQAARLWNLSAQFRQGVLASLRAAEVCFLVGDYRAALQRYEKIARDAARFKLKLEEAEALSESGRLHSLFGDNDAAEVRLNQGLSLLSQYRDANATASSRRVYAIAIANLGEINYSKGNLVKASDFLKQALAAWRDVGDRNGEARTHLFIGYIAGGLGQSDKASDEFSQALALYRATGDKSGEGSALTALGLVHSSRREEEQAIKLHREAGSIFRTIGDRQNEAITLNALGQVYENLSDYETALVNCREALKLFTDRGTLDFAAISLFKIAQIYKRSGNDAEALRYFQECLRISRGSKKERTEANALTEMIAIYAAQGNRVRTLAQYSEILKFYARIGDERGRAVTLNNLGDFLLSGENQSKALDSYRQALSLSERVDDPGILVGTLYNIARASLKLGALDEALTNIKRSITIIEARREQVGSPEFRISFFAGVNKHYQLAIDILMQLDRQRPGREYATEALLMSEQARARSLVDTLNQAGPMLREGATTELLQRERELQSLLRAHAQYRMELSLSHRSQAECNEVDRELEKLKSEYQEIESQLRVEQPALQNLMSPPRLTLKDIQSQLGNRETLLLEYALGDERSYLWCVTVDSVHSYELPARKILEESGRQLYQSLTTRAAVNNKTADVYQADVAAADAQYYQQAFRLSRMLLGPVAGQLGSNRLLIVSGGVLQYIPFDALPSPDGSVSESPMALNRPTLVADHEVITLPSISTLAAIRQQSHKPAATEKLVAVLADPVFSKQDDRVNVGPGESRFAMAKPNPPAPMLRDFAGTLRDGSVARLAHASDEADAIQSVSPRGTSLIAKGFAANREAAMSSQVGEYRIIHFATHGFLNSEHPELSGIVLSMVAPNGEQTNGLMPLSDIYNLNLSADLVVLSACETGLGKDVKGEGLVGLTRGFMSAGSKSVVASLWKVDDRATAALMSNFYKFMLQDGMTPSSALRAAKLKVREEKAWSAPYFWAGFVLQGEYNQPIVVDRKSWLRIALAVCLGLILISVGLIIRQRQHSAQLRRSAL